MKYFGTKVRLLIICGLLSPLISHAISPTVEARQIVNKAYQQLDMIAHNPNNVTIEGNVRTNFTSLFPTNDFWLPDEFKYMNSGTGGFQLRITNYIGNFGTFVREKSNFSFSYSIGSIQEIEAPDFSDKNMDVKFVEILVNKSYSYTGSRRPYTFTDTIIVGIDTKNIVQFRNVVNQKIDIQEENNYIALIESMKAEAAKLAKQGRYKESYSLYLKIVSRANDGDSYYRLAALIYDKNARKAIGIKKWREPVMQYLHKAVEYGQGKISYKAHNWINWLS